MSPRYPRGTGGCPNYGCSASYLCAHNPPWLFWIMSMSSQPLMAALHHICELTTPDGCSALYLQSVSEYRPPWISEERRLRPPHVGVLGVQALQRHTPALCVCKGPVLLIPRSSSTGWTTTHLLLQSLVRAQHCMDTHTYTVRPYKTTKEHQRPQFCSPSTCHDGHSTGMPRASQDQQISTQTVIEKGRKRKAKGTGDRQQRTRSVKRSPQVPISGTHIVRTRGRVPSTRPEKRHLAPINKTLHKCPE